MKRVEMRTVNGFVVLFGPVGLVQCAKRPLAYAALDLMTKNTIRQYPGYGGFDPHHRECKANSFDREG